MSTPLPESKNITFIVPSFDEIPEQATENVKDLFFCKDKNPFQTFKGNQWPCELKIQNSISKPTTFTTSKPAKVEILKYPKPDFKNIKPKVVSRPLVKTDNPSHIRNLLRSPSTSMASRNQKQVGACTLHFPSKITPSAVSKTIANRLQKPASNLRQRNGVLDKGSSSDSTSSLFSETAVTGAHNRFKQTTRNNKAEKTKSSVILVSLSCKESKECNNSPMANKETGRVRNVDYRILTWDPVSKTDLFLQTFSTKLAAAPDVSKSRVGQKPSLSKLKSSASPQTTSTDFRLPPAVPKLKLGSLSKDGRTTGIRSPPRTKQMSAHGTHKMPISTREKTSSARMSINTGAVSVSSSTGSRLPVKTSRLESSSSVSSLLSSQSETSTSTCRSQLKSLTVPPVSASSMVLCLLLIGQLPVWKQDKFFPKSSIFKIHHFTEPNNSKDCSWYFYKISGVFSTEPVSR
ncbi:MTUS1 protein, partial [Polyodon spathula]|nr:MTUS1 protein [Polyodon spathula]